MNRDISGRFWIGVSLGCALWAAGCSDMGKSPAGPDPGSGPLIDALRPSRTVAEDTVVVMGRGFGAPEENARVIFSGEADEVEAAIVNWSDTRITVLVPANARTGPMRVSAGTGQSPARSFELAPRRVYWNGEIRGLLETNCGGCHNASAPSGGLNVTSREGLFEGGIHGAAIIRRRGAESVLIQKLLAPPPFGDRMPQGGPYFSASEVLEIEDWIDQGAPETAPGPSLPVPILGRLLPSRTIAGDTVRVEGSRFGTAGSVRFSTTGGGSIEAESLAWSDTEILVLVPTGAVAGSVIVQNEGGASNGLSFEPAPRAISFQDDIVPIFQQYGCTSCHGGTNNLYVVPHVALMRGDSSHGPVVLRRRSGESLLVQKLLPSPPIGDTMPPFGDVGAENRRTIADWIDQGARE